MKRLLLLVLALALVCVPLTGFAQANKLTYQGSISFAVQAYTPDAGAGVTEMTRLAKEWEELHQGINIEFMPKMNDSDYTTWLKTKIAGGMAPDIFWAHWGEIEMGSYPLGCAIALNEYLDQPNEYVDGNEKWADMFHDSLMARTSGASGNQWVIDADYVGTAVYYNKTMFEAAGINMADYHTVVTWSDYLDICKKLKDAGYTAWSFGFGNDTTCTKRTWLQRLLLTNLYADIWSDVCFTNSVQPTLVDNYVAYKNGLIGPSSERWLSWWPMLKEMVDNYMPEDCVSSACTFDTIFANFVNGNVAMHWNSTGGPGGYAAANVDFEFGSFNFPVPDVGCNKYATNFDSSPAVGGPGGNFQYAISSTKANSSMTDEKTLACVDFLKYLTVPKNNEKLCNEVGTCLPSIIGTVPNEVNASLVTLLDSEVRSFHGGQESSAELTESTYRVFQDYLRGNVTLEEAANTLKPIWEEEYSYLYENNEESIAPYLDRIHAQ